MIASQATIPEQDSHEEFLKLVLEIHAKVVESLEWNTTFSAFSHMSESSVRAALHQQVMRIIERTRVRIPPDDHERLVSAVLSEAVGMGPLDLLLSDSQISDILVNRFDEIFIERGGRMIRTGLRFLDDQHVLRIIQRVASRIGRRLDESSPVVDARLPDGSRVHAIVPPLAARGPTLSIRRFPSSPLQLDQLVKCRSVSPQMAQFLAGVVTGRASCLISGGTGAGKTTLLNAMSAHIPEDERIVTIEDTAELRLIHPHVVALEARTANVDGKGEVTIRELVRNSLRMRPDRIIVGEVRGNEVVDMLQALNTGHEGSLTTIHANDTRDALSRLELMVSMAGYEFAPSTLRSYVASAIKVLVHVARMKGGVRRVVRISELTTVENQQYQLNELFGFKQTGVDSSGNAEGFFYATGYVPRCMEALCSLGASLDEDLFRRTLPA